MIRENTFEILFLEGLLAKVLKFDHKELSIASPEGLDFKNAFYENLYVGFYSLISEGEYGPQINADSIHGGQLEFSLVELAKANNVKIKPPSDRATNPERLLTQICLREFLKHYPEFSGLIYNTTSSTEIAISNAEWILGSSSNADNFINVKRIIDKLNLAAWDRELDTSERQSGVSTLGTISETLLATALEALVDDTNFFKVTHSQVQSYGDFVLMCLPNNLWLSVKSNFARERLLASGYSNDILAVGFFQDPSEFTGTVRVRNLQRAGFLAMYCPDVPVTEQQLLEVSSTYKEVCTSYEADGGSIPNNINGRPFIRPLSELRADIGKLLDIKDVRKRHTVGF